MIDVLLLSITILLIVAAISAFVFKRKTLALYVLTAALTVNFLQEILIQQDWFATIIAISFIGLVLIFAWKNDIQVLVKALYAVCLATILFQKSLPTVGLFAGVMFLIGLTPRPKEETLPKKASIGLSVLVIAMATLMSLLAIFGQANVSLTLSAYITLVTILVWDIYRELKSKP